jgi:pimeloyl-ACP methyl ester carboxylesterase
MPPHATHDSSSPSEKGYQIPTVSLGYENGGYYPEWFVRDKWITVITLGLSILGGVVAIIFQSDITSYIFLLFLIFFEIWLIIREFINRIMHRWLPISAPNVSSSEISLHIGGEIDLKGIQLIPHLHPSGTKLPVAIVFHGYNSRRGQMNNIIMALTQMGAAVISIDQRGHGTSGGDKNDIYYLMRDLRVIIEYIYQKPEFDSDRILVMGVSLGAIVSLYEGYLDPRVKYVIAMAAAAEYQEMITKDIKIFSRKWFWILQQRIRGLEVNPTALQSRLVSPAMIAHNRKGFFEAPIPWDVDNNGRILLLHCEDDYVIKVDNFHRNVKAFGLKKENMLLLKKGSHWFTQQELAVIGEVIGWLKHRGFFNHQSFL